MTEITPRSRTAWTQRETLALVWILGALVTAVGVSRFLVATLPVFTLLWLIIALVMLVVTRDARLLGMRAIPLPELVRVTAINLALWWGLMVLFEPWTHIYRDLVRLAVSGSTPDPTFGWLERYPGAVGWVGMALFSGLVSLFAEELLFRGWLNLLLKRHMPTGWAVALQAAIFSLPQLVVAFIFPPLQAIIWIVVYSWLAVGVVGGWAAARTQSIWPSLISATLTNLLLTMLVLR